MEKREMDAKFEAWCKEKLIFDPEIKDRLKNAYYGMIYSGHPDNMLAMMEIVIDVAKSDLQPDELDFV